MSDISFPEESSLPINPEADHSIAGLLDRIHQRALRGKQLTELLGTEGKPRGDFVNLLRNALFGETGPKKQRASVAKSEKLLTPEEQADINTAIEATRTLIFQKGKPYTESKLIADIEEQDREEGGDSADVHDMYQETKFIERGIPHTEDDYVWAHASPGRFIDDVVTKLTIDSFQPESKAHLSFIVRGDGTFDVQVTFPDHTGYQVRQQALDNMTDEESEIILYQIQQVKRIIDEPTSEIPSSFK